MVFDELVQIFGLGSLELHGDTGAGAGEPVAAELVPGSCRPLPLLRASALSRTRFRFPGRAEPFLDLAPEQVR